MKKILIAVPLLVVGLSACDVQDDYRAVCVDKYTNQYLPDYACQSGYGGSPFILGQPYYMSQSRYHDTFEVHHHNYNTVVTGGSTVMPTPSKGHKVGVAKVGAGRKVTVYEKQAGSPIKMNQDAKKVSSVSGSDRKFKLKDAPKKSSFNSYKPRR